MINVCGNISARALTPDGVAIYKKSVDVFSTVLDTAFGIVEQQTQDEKKE